MCSTDTEPPACPYCGAVLDDESQYDIGEGHDIKYACNTEGCTATAWTEERWEKQQDPGSMLAQYL